MGVDAALTCCAADQISWCIACDRTASEPLMVWADADLYICYQCANVERPWHDWGSSYCVTW